MAQCPQSSHPETSAIIKKRNPPDADVETLVNLLNERFPANTADTAPIPLSTELNNLGQKDNESLARPSDARIRNSFSQFDGFTLASVVQAFIKGIDDAYIRKKVYKGWQDDFSLRNVYNLAEQARRSKAEVAKRINEEAKDAELHQLRSFIQHLPPSQVERVKSALATDLNGLPEWLRQAQAQARSESTFQSQPLALPAPSGPAQSSFQQPEHRQQPEPRQIYEQRPSASGRPPLRDAPTSGNRRGPFRPEPKGLPEASKSKNPYINGKLIWSIDKDGVLCVGHIGRSCTHLPLPVWEQSYLRNLVFGDPPQVNFAIAGYGAYDGATKPYSSNRVEDNDDIGWKPHNGKPLAGPKSTPGILPATWRPNASASSNSLGYGFSGLKLDDSKEPSEQTTKRPHVEEPEQPEQPQQPTQDGQGQFQFTAGEPPKKKGQKRVGKKADPMPLVGQMDNFGTFNKPVSIRQVLMDNKINMSFMDLMV
ncbi:MAG: hypothetical protein Q9188_005090 [Gyalolechia gomerana]